LNIVFFGTPEFAVTIADKLAERHKVLAAVTRPDKPVGRKRVITPPPVKAWAVERGIPVLQPKTLRSNEAHVELAELAADIFIVAAYGAILPENCLNIPPHGCVNAHASLLPKYRGASPIARAILDGESVTGVTIMRMDAGLDTGDMILKRGLNIEPDDDVETLTARLAACGAEAVLEAVSQIEAGEAVYTPQENCKATYAAKVSPEECAVSWADPANVILNKIRGLHPQPGAYTVLDGRRVKLLAAKPSENIPGRAPGSIEITKGGLIVTAGGGAVLLARVQPDGGKPMNAADFARGSRLSPDARFTDPEA